MADRIPLVVDGSNYRVEELPSGDTLDLNASTVKNATFTGVTTFPAGSVSSPALTGPDSDTGFYFPTSNNIAVSAGGTEQLRVNAQGVGIGTTGVAANSVFTVVGGVNLDGVGVAASSFIVRNEGFLTNGISTTVVDVTFDSGNGPVVIVSDVIVSASLSTGSLILLGGGFLPLTNNQKIITEVNKQNVLGVAYTDTTTKIANGFRFTVGITTGENRQINVMVFRAGSSGNVNISFASTIT